MGKKSICPVCGREVGWLGVTWKERDVKSYGFPEYKGMKMHLRCAEKLGNKGKLLKFKREMEGRLREETDNWSKKVYVVKITKFLDFFSITGGTPKLYEETIIEIMLEHGYELKSYADGSSFWIDLSYKTMVFVKRE